MTTWNCIDRMDDTTWEYVPLGIMEDLRRIPDAVSAWLPGPVADDTAWTSIISGSHDISLGRDEEDAEMTSAA